ncbi:hypothetical protein ACX4MZ_21465 [Roseomonas mucosa]
MPRITQLLGRFVPLVLATLTACQMPIAPTAPANAGVAIDPAVRQMIGGLADRFTQARQAGGMVGVSAEIQSCYQTATLPRQVRDCLALDAVARRVDMETARILPGGELPYFSEQPVTRRWAHYNRAANFANLQQQITYMADVSDAVILEMARRQHAG